MAEPTGELIEFRTGSGAPFCHCTKKIGQNAMPFSELNKSRSALTQRLVWKLVSNAQMQDLIREKIQDFPKLKI